MSIPARRRLLTAIALIAIAAMPLLPRMGQDPAYHDFADRTALLSLPNALNVLSNLVFLWAGTAGLLCLAPARKIAIRHEIRFAYPAFFAVLILVAFASAYYHWAPDNAALAIDRGAMILAFAAFFTIVLGERVSPRAARRLVPWLLVAGLGSVAYWYLSEYAGRGDLRPYALFQFLPVLLLPCILLLFESRYTRGADLWWLLGCYLAARVCELLDREIYAALGLLSGHSLKHILIGVGCLVLLRHLRRREPIGT